MTKATLVRPVLAALVALVGLSALLIMASGVSNAGITARVSPIDTENRAAVAASYQRHVVDNARLAAGWNGSADGCVAGETSIDYTRATIETINWFRAMTGLPNVTEDRGDSDAAQEAALMMHAANSLSHQPTDSWACHSASGAGAAGRSNLTLGIAGPRGVIGQIEDAGAGNVALGHRRWLLYPELAAVGVGNTDRASAVEVIGNFGGGRSGSAWIAWPPAGFVPDDAVFDRWSVAFNGAAKADFSNAQVTMTSSGRAIPARLLPRSEGFGDATLAWEPADHVSDVGRDTSYQVSITNIIINGNRRSHSYEVVVFDAATSATPAATPAWPTCQGMPATIVGTAGADTIRGSSGPDVIVSYGGNDTIYGNGGADRICAGAGNDIVHGGSGGDLISGGRGRDRLRGGAGTDSCWGQTSNSPSARNERVRSCERIG